MHFCQWSGGIFFSLMTWDCSSTFSSTGFYSAGKWVRFVEHDWIKIVPGLYIIIYDYAAGKQCRLGCLCGHIPNYSVHSGKQWTYVSLRHWEGQTSVHLLVHLDLKMWIFYWQRKYHPEMAFFISDRVVLLQCKKWFS